MKPDKINSWLTLIANAGVLAGIVFLVIEIRQNTLTVQSQTRDSMAAKNIEYQYAAISSPEFMQAFQNASEIMSDPQFDQDFFTLARMFDARLKIWENESYQYRQGLFEEEEFQGRIASWNFVLGNQPSLQAYWELRRSTYSARFVDLIDKIIIEINTD